MDPKKKFIITLTGGFILIVICFIIISQIANMTGKTITGETITSRIEIEGLSNCLAKNSIAYMTNHCIDCENQEQIFEEFSQNLNIINCMENQELCLKSNINSFPTWIIKGKRYLGVKSINQLLEISDC